MPTMSRLDKPILIRRSFLKVFQLPPSTGAAMPYPACEARGHHFCKERFISFSSLLSFIIFLLSAFSCGFSSRDNGYKP